MINSPMVCVFALPYYCDSSFNWWTVEVRRVPPDVFVDQFMESQVVVSKLKKHFGQSIGIIFIEKNIEITSKRPQFNVTDIDAVLRKKYNREYLQAIVKSQ